MKKLRALPWLLGACALLAAGCGGEPSTGPISISTAGQARPAEPMATPEATAAATPEPDADPARTAVLPGSSPRHHALVFGNSAYPHGDALTAPARDAALMARALRARGYQVRLSLDRDYAGMVEDIEAFAETSEGAQVRVLYFAGHGFEFDSENYLLPVDIPAPIAGLDRDQVRSRGLPLNRLLADLEAEGGTLVGIIDACRVLPARGAADTPTLGEQAAPQGSILAFATAPGQVAMDSLRSFGVEQDHSPFTYFLANHLLAPETRRWDQAFQATYGIVRNQTRGRQEPWTNYKVTEVPEIGPAPAPASGGAREANPLGIELRPERKAAALYWQREAGAIWKLARDGATTDRQLAQRAAEGDDLAALAAVFRVPEDGRDPAPLLRLLQRPADAGHALAQEEAGNRLWAAKAHDAQGRSAKYWWQLSCANGLGSACTRLAMAGDGSPDEQARAMAQGFAEMFSGFSQAMEADLQRNRNQEDDEP